MATLTRTPKAQNVLSKFHGVQATVWLEGQDDVAFWEEFYKKLKIPVKLKFKRAGNCTQLDVYINDIVVNNSRAIAIRDRDYLTSKIVSHPQVIYTYGHSLENTIYSPRNLSSFIALLTRTKSRYGAASERWLSKLASDLSPLIELEISNDHFNKRKPIMGKSGGKFLKSGSSSEVDASTVATEYQASASHFTASEIAYGKNYLASFDKPIHLLIRGHFLTVPVKKYIHQVSKSVNTTAKITKFDEPQIFISLMGQIDIDKLHPKEGNYLLKSISGALRNLGLAI